MNLKEENVGQLKTMRENLKSLREAKNWSLATLSEISGISVKILTGIEKGKDFEVEHLFTLCDIYSIKPREIFFRII